MRTSGLTLIGILIVGATASAQDAIRATEVSAEHVGEKIAVEGRVYSSAETAAGQHLYFGADTSTAFQAIVTADSLYKFQVDVEKKFTRRNVRVTGTVEEENGKYFIRVTQPSQIKVVARRRRSQ